MKIIHFGDSTETICGRSDFNVPSFTKTRTRVNCTACNSVLLRTLAIEERKKKGKDTSEPIHQIDVSGRVLCSAGRRAYVKDSSLNPVDVTCGNCIRIRLSNGNISKENRLAYAH